MNAIKLKIALIIAVALDYFAIVYLSRDGIPYLLARTFGRMAIPLVCFLLVEGLRNTQKTGKYILRVSLAALVTEIFWLYLWLQQRTEALENIQLDYIRAGGTPVWGEDGVDKWFDTLDTAQQYAYSSWMVPLINGLFTLVVTMLMLLVIKKFNNYFKEMLPNQVFRNLLHMMTVGALIMITVLICFMLQMEGGILIPVTATVCFLFRDEKKMLFIGLALVGLLGGAFTSMYYAIGWMFALPLLHAYNGKLGYDKKAHPYLRWVFYAVCPTILGIMVEAKYFREIFNGMKSVH